MAEEFFVSRSALFRVFCKSTDSAGRKAQFHSSETLCLKVYFELATSSNVGVAPGIACLCSAAGHLAHSAHRFTVEELQK